MLRNLLYGSRFLFHFKPKPQCDAGELVVLIHGLMHSGFHMYSMGRFLARHGYESFCYDYRTTRGDVARHAGEFKRHLEKLLASHPGRKLNIVTHSLGSLVTRQVLADNPQIAAQVKCVVMLAPPNRGSKAASLALKVVPMAERIMYPLPDLSYGDQSPVHRIPIPREIPIGIIAASHDILVPRDSTPLAVQSDYLIAASGHSYIMMRPKVQRQVLEFLRHGKFISGEAEKNSPV